MTASHPTLKDLAEFGSFTVGSSQHFDYRRRWLDGERPTRKPTQTGRAERKIPRKRRKKRLVLTEAQVSEIVELKLKGVRNSYLCKKFGASLRAIQNIEPGVHNSTQ